MKIKKNYQNPKTTKRQKEEQKELNEYKGMRFDAFSTACISGWDFGSVHTIVLPNGIKYKVIEKID